MLTLFNEIFGNTASNDRMMTNGMERGRKLSWTSLKVDSSRNVMTHGDARDGKWWGKLANGVGSQYSSHYLGTWRIQHYCRWCAHLGWTDASVDLSGLVRFAERQNLVSARLPSHFNWPLLFSTHKNRHDLGGEENQAAKYSWSVTDVFHIKVQWVDVSYVLRVRVCCLLLCFMRINLSSSISQPERQSNVDKQITTGAMIDS